MLFRPAVAALAGALLLVPTGARAQDAVPASGALSGPPTPAPLPAPGKATDTSNAPASNPSREVTEQARSYIIDRPHTIAELGVGIIALPNAPISAGQRGGATPFGTIGRGDATLQVGAHVLYRPTRAFAVGADISFAPLPTADTEYGGLKDLPRSHARSYFFIGGEGRYIPIHYKFLEAWVGASVGGVVVADRFTTNAGDDVAPILGSKESTIRTEGFAFGVQLGGTYYLSENWVTGVNFRAFSWVLPETQRCSSIGDCATLSGTVEAIEFGLTIGYRLPL